MNSSVQNVFSNSRCLPPCGSLFDFYSGLAIICLNTGVKQEVDISLCEFSHYRRSDSALY